MTDTDPEACPAEAYTNRFHSDPEYTIAAPGRVELLGNHTDYNEGFVISVALDMNICMAGGEKG
ncbi:galactokinase family protein [Planctomycetota bacterium]